MIYLVSGYMRSGTSMMMQCLEAGGMDVAYSIKRTETANKLWSDDQFKSNANGFYEFSPKEMEQPDFPAKHDGKVIKLVTPWLKFLKGHKARVLFMLRNPEEIRQSSEAVLSMPLKSEWIGIYPLRMAAHIRRLKDSGCDVQTVDFKKVITNPLECLGRLDWPIDPVKAATAVKPDLYRFRIERLVVGL